MAEPATFSSASTFTVPLNDSSSSLSDTVDVMPPRRLSPRPTARSLLGRHNSLDSIPPAVAGSTLGDPILERVEEEVDKTSILGKLLPKMFARRRSEPTVTEHPKVKAPTLPSVREENEPLPQVSSPVVLALAQNSTDALVYVSLSRGKKPLAPAITTAGVPTSTTQTDTILKKLQKAKEQLQTLADARDAIPYSKKTKLKAASDAYNNQAKLVVGTALTYLKNSEDLQQVEFGFAFLQEVLKHDKFSELESHIFVEIMRDPRLEAQVMLKLTHYLKDAINSQEANTILRESSCWELTLLKIMHLGYLAPIFDKLDPLILEIGQSDDNTDKALKCIECVRASLHMLSPLLREFYMRFYLANCGKFEEPYACTQLAQLFFLRGVNARITKLEEFRYTKLDEKAEETAQLVERKRYRRCSLVAAEIQKQASDQNMVKDGKCNQESIMYNFVSALIQNNP